jgi:hypothetical protein
LTTAELAGWVGELALLDTAVDDAERIDQIRQLEQVKSACAAAQARVTAAFAASQRQAQRDAGVPARNVGAGIAGQVALARRDSAVKGGRHLGLAEALVREMPETLAALEQGRISEWRATLMVKETACLSVEDRGTVDSTLADSLEQLGDKQTAAQARRLAYALDPKAFMARVRGAQEDRRVTLRPAPDTMSLVTGFLPVAQGVAVHAALTRTADSLRAQGDSRSRGQIMADELVQRVTGQTQADAVPVEVQLVMSDRTLLDGDDEPAELPGHGPIPAELARGLVGNPEVETWVRRLFTRSGADSLVAMDSRSRTFPAGMKRFVALRDGWCRTLWCEAPIRHTDHPTPVAEGGRTTVDNAQGLCEACNYAKEALGWVSRVLDHRTIEVTTPTGHRYRSRPPPLPGASPPTSGPRPTGGSHPLTGTPRLTGSPPRQRAPATIPPPETRPPPEGAPGRADARPGDRVSFGSAREAALLRLIEAAA